MPNHFIPTQFGIKALKYFNYYIPLSERFLIDAEACLNKEQYTVCVFMLHQVVEQVCIGLIKVFMDYRSEIHDLHKLLRLCGTFSDAPVKVFLSGSPEDERLFDILLKSYSSTRYKRSLVVLTDDAWALYNKTTAFVALAKDLCIAKITQLEQAAECHREYAAQLSTN